MSSPNLNDLMRGVEAQLSRGINPEEQTLTRRETDLYHIITLREKIEGRPAILGINHVMLAVDMLRGTGVRGELQVMASGNDLHFALKKPTPKDL